MSKVKILMSVLCFMLLLTGVCWSAEKPLGDITRQDAINKLFTGRTLDPIEGIWYLNERWEVAIVKTSLLTLKNPKDKEYDYICIIIKDGWTIHARSEVGSKLKKTEHPFIFMSRGFMAGGQEWRIISPWALQMGQVNSDSVNYSHTIDGSIFLRLYPAVQPSIIK